MKRAAVIPITRRASRLDISTIPLRKALNATQWNQAVRYLDKSLQGSWEKYFSPRRAGRNWGLPIVCTYQDCGERPPKEVRSWNRWRWLAVHEAVVHRR